MLAGELTRRASQPPELEILEIGDLSKERFRGIFRLTYAGDAHIVLQTKVQANPLNNPRPSVDVLSDAPRIVFAAAPLEVPMTLRLSALSLRAIVVLVVSRQKGITLVFKNDPLESVQVSSSFDGAETVASYIQREIEHQLREAFRSDLPSVIHRLSQKWLAGEVNKATSPPEAPAPPPRDGEGAREGLREGFAKGARLETMMAHERGYTSKLSVNGGGDDMASLAAPDTDAASTFSSFPPSRPRLGSRLRSSVSAGDEFFKSASDEFETYDPTYGLRPDALPLNAGFRDYGRVVRKGDARGLGDILGDVDESDELVLDEGESVAGQSVGQSVAGMSFETIPAVGGGTVTRPRVFHTQSQMTRSSDGESVARPRPPHRRISSLPSVVHKSVPLSTPTYPISPASSRPPSPPPYAAEPPVFPPQRPSALDLLSASPDSAADSLLGGGADASGTFSGGLLLAPRDSCAHLATLAHANRTLSPFARPHEHVMSKAGLSGAPSSSASAAGGSSQIYDTRKVTQRSNDDGAPVRARRKRVFRIGAAKPRPVTSTPAREAQPVVRPAPFIDASPTPRRMPVRSASVTSMSDILRGNVMSTSLYHRAFSPSISRLSSQL